MQYQVHLMMPATGPVLGSFEQHIADYLNAAAQQGWRLITVTSQGNGQLLYLAKG
jgi:hypothetical protein